MDEEEGQFAFGRGGGIVVEADWIGGGATGWGGGGGGGEATVSHGAAGVVRGSRGPWLVALFR